MREILAMPDHIKVLGCDVTDPGSTKQVVLTLAKLFPRDEVVLRLIEGLQAKI
jgi:hypothetical protein